MGMSTHVVGIVPADEKYKAMLDVYRACEKAGIPIPEEVEAFFEGKKPDLKGILINLTGPVPHYAPNGVTKWEGDGDSGFEVDLDALDPKIRRLRFYNSW